MSACATIPPGAGGFPAAKEPEAVQVDAIQINREGVPYYVIRTSDMERLTAYVNALRLAFRENLVSLQRCAGP